jgi:hypothetical protein
MFQQQSLSLAIKSSSFDFHYGPFLKSFFFDCRPNARDSETHFRKHEKLPRFLSLKYFYIFNRVNFIHQVSNLSL